MYAVHVGKSSLIFNHGTIVIFLINYTLDIILYVYNFTDF